MKHKIIYLLGLIIIIISFLYSSINMKALALQESLLPTGDEAETETEISIPPTLEKMSRHNYTKESLTRSWPRLTGTEINEKVAAFGWKFTGGPGLLSYEEIMEYPWTDLTVYGKEARKVTINLKKRMTYSDYEECLLSLSRYEGVYLYQIGESAGGKKLYCLEIDMESEYEKETIMLAGTVHSREQAGWIYILKQMSDLIQDSQKDKAVMEMLRHYRFTAVPMCSADVTQELIWNPSQWMTKSGWYKALANGIDLNRSFPSLTGGWVKKGNKLNSKIAAAPAPEQYQGRLLGESPETKALMKWAYHYVVTDQAICYIDYHQQGRILYAGQPVASAAQNNASNSLRKKLLAHLNQGNWAKYTAAGRITAAADYDGAGGTVSEYVTSCALGKYSSRYGSYVFWDGVWEYPPVMLLGLDQAFQKGVDLEIANTRLRTITLEIGADTGYLGGTAAAYQRNAAEYEKYHFDTMLKKLPGMLHN